MGRLSVLPLLHFTNKFIKNITPGHPDLQQSQTEIDASLGAVFSTAVGRDTFNELYSDEHPFHIKWPKLYEQLHLRRTTDSFNRYREWIDESSASTSQPTEAPPAPKRVSASELQEFIKRPRVT